MKSMNKRICLLGGWAVYHSVNNSFFKKKNRPYLGSHDIDFGMYIEPMMSKNKLTSSTLFKIIHLLESEDFHVDGIRYRKDITYITKDEKESFPLYIDIIINSYPPSYSDIIPQYFFEEPLLEEIYRNSQNQVEIPQISHHLFMPIPEILSAIKIRCILGRDIHHKRVKDLCDLYSLLFYSQKSFKSTVEGLKKYIAPDAVRQVKGIIDEKLMRESEEIIGEPPGSINTVISNLFNEFEI
jgi:hypothetical protein